MDRVDIGAESKGGSRLMNLGRQLFIFECGHKPVHCLLFGGARLIALLDKAPLYSCTTVMPSNLSSSKLQYFHSGWQLCRRRPVYCTISSACYHIELGTDNGVFELPQVKSVRNNAEMTIVILSMKHDCIIACMKIGPSSL